MFLAGSKHFRAWFRWALTYSPSLLVRFYSLHPRLTPRISAGQNCQTCQSSTFFINFALLLPSLTSVSSTSLTGTRTTAESVAFGAAPPSINRNCNCNHIENFGCVGVHACTCRDSGLRRSLTALRRSARLKLPFRQQRASQSYLGLHPRPPLACSKYGLHHYNDFRNYGPPLDQITN